jgi:hypothetical protein
MANSNFVVHNGLTVGPLTIDAATGNITTTNGNVLLSGGLSIQGDLNVSGVILDSGAPAATLADATALAIALGG